MINNQSSAMATPFAPDSYTLFRLGLHHPGERV